MQRDHLGLIPLNTPLIFSDGTEVFNKLAHEYKVHKKGYFIMAPSGAGKTYFVQHQKDKNWMDGDYLWQSTFAHPDGEWWLEPIPVIDEIDQRSDIITVQAKKLGFWIVGASNNWLPPDAIVIPDWETHKSYINSREKGNYDGGATSDHLKQVMNHREWILKWAEKGVPKFESMQDAAKFLENKSV
jgi:hypothetical protein